MIPVVLEKYNPVPDAPSLYVKYPNGRVEKFIRCSSYKTGMKGIDTEGYEYILEDEDGWWTSYVVGDDGKLYSYSVFRGRFYPVVENLEWWVE